MSLGTIVPNLLAQLDLLQLSDHPGRQDKRNQKRGDSRIDDPKALIAKDIQERKLCMKRIQPVVEHAVFTRFAMSPAIKPTLEPLLHPLRACL